MKRCEHCHDSRPKVRYAHVWFCGLSCLIEWQKPLKRVS